MRWFIQILLGLFWVAVCQAKVNDLGIQLQFEKKTLSNGLTVILVEDPTVPMISYQTWFRVGSVDEQPGMTGISHLFEHLMFKGTPKFGPKEFFHRLESKGSEVNAFTTRDYTVYYQNISPDLLDITMAMESDRMANLTVSEEALNNEKLIVFEERRLRTENVPEARMQEALWQLAFRRHPYQWPVIGYPMDLVRISAENLRTYFKQHYQPANAALVIVGNFESKSIYEKIKKYYGDVPATSRPERNIPVEPEQKEERRLILRDRTVSERFLYGYHVSSASEDDSYALDVLSNILFEGTTSRAHKLLVDEKDLVLTVAGSAFTPTYPGLMMISGVMKKQKSSDLAEKHLNGLIQDIQDHGVSDSEVQVAVKQLTVQVVDGVQTPYGLGQLIGTVQMVFGDPKRFVDDLAKYTKVKKEDVQRVAQKYLQLNNRSVVTLVGSEK